MISTTMFTALLAVTSIVSVSAAPTKTDGLAARSVVSNGVTCYFTCPTDFPNFNFIAGGASDGNENDYLCGYANDNASASCFYDRATGALSTVEESTAGCPANAAGPNCNIGPTSQNFKKRAVARELTVAEQEIKKRQFHVERQG